MNETAETPSPKTPPRVTTESPKQNELTPVPATTGIGEIRGIFFDGTGSSELDEDFMTENDDSIPIQFNKWTLGDEANHYFTFPNLEIQPNQEYRVHTNEIHPEGCVFKNRSGSTICM